VSRLTSKHYEKAKQAARALDQAARPLRILRSVAWGPDVKADFLSNQRLPRPAYIPIDTREARSNIAHARTLLKGDNVIFAWLRRLSETLDRTAALIDSRNTADFFSHSVKLFGEPHQFMLDKKTRVIDLAYHLDDALDGLDFSRLVNDREPERLTATQFAKLLRPRLRLFFGEARPSVKISSELSANAVAGAKRIRVRRDANFTRRDVDQLLQHEAFIHTATALNGRAQSDFPILGRAHAGTTQIQEGLAVFAEMISGAMDPDRFQRLSDRVIAIQKSIDGADFKDVFNFYMERLDDPDQAFENTRRIFRGGVMSGGAPFTKDGVYLNGLLRVHNFIRTIVKLGRADLIRTLFVGKMDIEDVPALAQLASDNHIAPARFLPPWVDDLRFLVSYMAYSSFLNQVKLPGFQDYYKEALTDVPVIWDF